MAVCYIATILWAPGKVGTSSTMLNENDAREKWMTAGGRRVSGWSLETEGCAEWVSGLAHWQCRRLSMSWASNRTDRLRVSTGLAAFTTISSASWGFRLFPHPILEQ